MRKNKNQPRQLLNCLCLLLMPTMIAFSARANPGDVRFLTQLGVGEAVSHSAGTNKEVRSEKPGAIAFAVDQNLYGAFYLFAEHLRSFGATGSSIGLTGIGFKYFPWLTPTQNRLINPNFTTTQISSRGYLPFVGLGTGFAQASIMGDGVNTADNLAVTGYLSMKAGCEYAIGDKWGLTTEWNFATSVVGSGSIQAVNLIFGAYVSF